MQHTRDGRTGQDGRRADGLPARPHAHDPGVTAWWWVRQGVLCFSFSFAVLLWPILSGWGWMTVYLSAWVAP